MNRNIAELDINLLIALDALLRDANVTHAAARLNITQSALSGRLNKLRQVLNDPLFIPASSGRGMTPTLCRRAVGRDTVRRFRYPF